MKTIRNVSIPNPCYQQWDDMTSVQSGRHCTTCAKTVVDFSAMSDEDVIAHLSLNQKVCGRFDHEQLEKLNGQFTMPAQFVLSGWKKWSLALGLLTSFGYFKADAQVKQATVQTQDKSNPSQKSVINPGNALVTITGKIVDEQRYSLRSVFVVSSDGKYRASTDSSGVFNIQVPKNTDYLFVRAIGFLQKVLLIDMNKSVQETIVLKPDTWMGEVMINPPKISLYDRYFKWLKGERSY